jgi:radical SAM protein with 4Fe4S-binding SPASM domain
MAAFYRVYVELTNICGLKCSFCPPKTLPTQTMDLAFFERVLAQLRPYTHEIAYHIVGDPMSLSNLQAYLDVTHRYGFRVMLTTSGYYLDRHATKTLLHPALKQLNISLNSYNKNDTSRSFEAYMEPIVSLCRAKLQTAPELFINLRLWNLDEDNSEEAYNKHLFDYLEQAFETTLNLQTVYIEKPRSLRVAPKILLHFDRYFQWPSLQQKEESEGSCLGLQSHFGILADGTVVPCCLDKDGIVALGNLHTDSLESILQSTRAKRIVEGFKHGKAVEELCRKCTYKERFKEES